MPLSKYLKNILNPIGDSNKEFELMENCLGMWQGKFTIEIFGDGSDYKNTMF